MSITVAPSALLPQVRTPRSMPASTLVAVGRGAALAGVDDDLRRRGRVVGDRVRLGPADDRDVAGRSRGGSPSSGTIHASPRTIGHERERRLVLDPQRPGRIHDRAQQEGAAGAGAVEEAGERVHPDDRRRSHMNSRFSTMDSLPGGLTVHEQRRQLDTGAGRHRQDRPPRGQRLQARGRPVRIGSRAGEPPFDWDDRATWAPALDGVDAAYVSVLPRHRRPGRRRRRRGVHASWPWRAACAGWCCSPAAARRRPSARAGSCRRRRRLDDRALQLVRQNFSEGFLLDAVLAGELALPVGDVPEPFVDVDDIADVAVAALTEDGHAGSCTS